MRRLLLVLVLIGQAARAQVPIDVARGERLFQKIDDIKKPEKLRGKIYPMRTALNLSFRFQLNYFFETPLNQFEGRRHRLSVLARVVPEEKPPVYLGALYRLPNVPAGVKSNNLMNIGGMFFLGQGRYTIDLLITDDKGRVLRSTQHVKAELKGAEKQIRSLTPPGTVASLSSLSLTKGKSVDGKPIRLTLLLHAAPGYFRSTTLRPQDVGRLLGATAALIDQMNVRSLRVVAFNLDQQKELYRRDHFEPESFEELSEALEPVELGTVDVKVLQNRLGHIDLLSDLISKELHAEDPADAVIVLGPTARQRDSVRAGVIEENAAGVPQFFYLEYKSMREMFEMRANMQGQMPDTIESAIKRVSGKVFRIFTPGDFAKAISEIAKRATG